mgnify:CR=1 FL=1|jgi:hypothetical protein
MSTNLPRIVTATFTGLLIAACAAQVHAEVVPKILYRQSLVGVQYIIKELSDGDTYLKIQRVNPASPAKRSGLQAGDWISKVGSTRVNSRARFDAAILAAPNRTTLRVWDQNSRQWTSIDIVLRSVGEPEPPEQNGNGNNGQNPILMTTWRSSLGGTIRFTRNQQRITGQAHAPLAGWSDLFVTPNGDGSYHYTYQQRNGLRDSGHGKLTPRNWNTIDAYLINSLGIRVEFTLTR